eukprot:1139189-Pelagomonas_calceolata.AAC.2
MGAMLCLFIFNTWPLGLLSRLRSWHSCASHWLGPLASQIAVAAVVAGSVWATDRGLGALRIPRHRLLSQVALAAGVGLLGWHLGTSLSRHLWSVFKKNRRVKGQLLDDWTCPMPIYSRSQFGRKSEQTTELELQN